MTERTQTPHSGAATGSDRTARPRRRARTAPFATLQPANDAFPVVGIGASAGGLNAFRTLIDALPADTGIAPVLISHLDPTHASTMVDLLGSHTTMPVSQAANGMLLERDHVYIIPPQAYLSVRNGALEVSAPQAPHGARRPFDIFLNSLAEEYNERPICVVLSGAGADGSIGLQAVSEKGGLVIAEDPDEAAFDGMPRSAIGTGAVNLVAEAIIDTVGEPLIVLNEAMCCGSLRFRTRSCAIRGILTSLPTTRRRRRMGTTGR